MKQTLLLIFTCFSVLAHAQQTGRITGSDRKPLEGATISNLRSGAHAHSSPSGFFFLKEARTGDSLLITHIAHAARWVVAGTDSLLVQLESVPFQLDNVTITSEPKHLHIFSDIDLRTNPVKSSQELLRKVPGLFIGQHAGGGKAEQIFLRGFDIDHGTDINIIVDGMPVNMVSHAHGQGYADLHFLIPETVDKIDFDKGPYQAAKGNMATAGYVAFQTKDHLDNSSITLEAGKFNTLRTLGMFNLASTEKQSAWLATEYLRTNGWFESPQNFNRLNLMGKYATTTNTGDRVTLSFSHLNSKWDASGQIPQRAIEAGLISRFGAIDDTEGGNTSRTNLNLQFTKQLKHGAYIKNSAFFNHYNFELYSNFTFFLEDPVNGDQIRQKEKRNITGFESVLHAPLSIGNLPLELNAGVGLRNDAVSDMELSHTRNRQETLQQIQFGDVNETNLYTFAGAELRSGKWVINPSVRVDHFQFEYLDKLAPSYKTLAQQKSIVSPKLNFLYNQDRQLQLFLKLGKGFHSNDTRVVVAQSGEDILPAAYGADIGAVWKPLPRLVLNTALWYLYLQQEFVYVGDAGIVEPGGKTQRKGIDVSARYQWGKYVFINGDFTYTHARAIDEAKGEDLIPLAPKITVAGGVSFKHPSGWNGALQSRHLGDRPANEDGSITAKGYFITDANISYQWKCFTIGVIMENIFNSAWNETQFATESRLVNEPVSVTEIHFTPGTPFNVRGMVVVRF